MLLEMGEIMSLNVSDINFSQVAGDLYYSFKIGEDKYNVKFSPRISMVGWGKLWYVDFQGPDGWNLTQQYKSHRVYLEFLRACKAFLEQYKPDGLTFFGYDHSQDIMYDVMMKKYLGPEQGKPDHFAFYPIEKEIFISERCIKSKSPEEQAELRQEIARFADNHKQSINKMRQQKIDNRQQMLQGKRPVQQMPMSDDEFRDSIGF